MTGKRPSEKPAQDYARIILDAMYQFLGLLDAEGEVLEINKAALDGAGIRLDEVVGKPFWETHWWDVSEENRVLVREMVRRAGQGEFIRCDIEVYGDLQGKKKIFVDFSLTPIRNETGEVVYLLPEGRNITEKIVMEAELTRKNEELHIALEKLRELDGFKTQFFANVSHELRTPLALILGAIDQLLRHAKNLDARDLFRIQTMKHSAQSLIQEVNNLLDLARIDAGQMPVSYTRLNIAQCIKEIAAAFAPAAEEREISLQLTGPEALYAEVDRAKFSRVVANLLSNALKFTPAGGQIICLTRQMNHHQFMVRVQDNGPGVPNQHKEQIFARFAQGQNGFSDIGSGIGLNIVRDFVEIQGGSVSLRDAPDGGAVFEIVLPLHAPAGTSVRSDEATATHPVHADLLMAPDQPLLLAERQASSLAANILIVEDNASLRSFLYDVLADDYAVTLAANGAEGLALAADKPLDLVITDLMMPVMDGEQFIRALRDNSTLNHLPVIVLSARADERLRETLLDGFVQDYLTKPFSAQELRVRIANLITVKQTVALLQKELNSQTSDIGDLTAELLKNSQSLQKSLAALRQSEERWAGLYNNTAVGIALADEAGCILKANPALQHMLGYDAEEIIGVSFVDISEAPLQALTQANVHGVVDGSVKNYSIQKRYRKKDGQLLWANVSVSLIPPVGTDGPRLAVLVEDISARKDVEKKLGTAQANLAQVSRYATMGELVSTIAHEVNQPLAAIATNSQAALRWLSREEPDYQEVVDALNRVNRDANLASNVIARIRKFISKGEVAVAPVDLRIVLQDLQALFQAMLSEAGVTLTIKIEPSLPVFEADQIQLQQVLFNLIANAIDAMREQGYGVRIITVEATYSHAEGVVVAIQDTGPGVADATHAKIFDVFFSTKKQGLGMGLAISRTIIERHGGRLWLENAMGEGAAGTPATGAKFVFNIPLAR